MSMSRPIPEGVEECGCVIATADNTPSVRKGWEMGGYIKTRCEKHQKERDDLEKAAYQKKPDKDALIRELIKAGTFLRQDLEVELYSRSVGADEWQSLIEWKAAITLARTTCPEAFQ